MKILITGAAGMLGSYLYKYLNTLEHYEIKGTVRKRLHSDSDLIEWDMNQTIAWESHFIPDVIIHCAAITSLQDSEHDILKSIKINASIIESLSLINPNAKFIYISTDSVFNGEAGNYSEFDIPNPVNNYAISKLKGELITSLKFKDYYILRTNIYGYRTPLGNSLFEWAYINLTNNNTINGFTNVLFNPLYIGQLSILIDQFITQNPEVGIYNVASTDYIDKYQFLVQTANLLNCSSQLVNPDIYKDTNIVRPLNTTLNTSKLVQLFPELETTLSLQFGLNHLMKDITTAKLI